MFRSSNDPVLQTLVPVPRLTSRVMIHLAGLFFVSRLVVLTVAALSHMVVAPGPFYVSAKTWIERFSTWDSGWYLAIATLGYEYDPHTTSSVAFYPLYPLLIRSAGYFGMDMRLAGYAIPHAALLGACVQLWRLAALETRSESIAERSVIFLLFCPGAVWFGMIYTESLFLVTLLGCLLCARQNKWVAAGCWGAACALTRTPGLLLAGFLFSEAVQQWRERPRPLAGAVPADPRKNDDVAALPSWRRTMPKVPWMTRVALGVVGPVLGHLSYLIFLQVRFGDWRAQQKTMSAGWMNGKGIALPWKALATEWQINYRYLVLISNPLLFITILLALVGVVTLKRVGYAALVLTLAIMYVSATTGDSLTRYLSTAAPVYIVLAQMADRSRLLETTALVFSVAIMVLLTIFVMNGYHAI